MIADEEKKGSFPNDWETSLIERIEYLERHLQKCRSKKEREIIKLKIDYFIECFLTPLSDDTPNGVRELINQEKQKLEIKTQLKKLGVNNFP